MSHVQNITIKVTLVAKNNIYNIFFSFCFLFCFFFIWIRKIRVKVVRQANFIRYSPFIRKSILYRDIFFSLRSITLHVKCNFAIICLKLSSIFVTFKVQYFVLQCTYMNLLLITSLLAIFLAFVSLFTTGTPISCLCHAMVVCYVFLHNNKSYCIWAAFFFFFFDN